MTVCKSVRPRRTSRKEKVFQRAIPLRLPVVQARSGLIPRKATLELPMPPAHCLTRRSPPSRTRAAIPRSERASLLPIVAANRSAANAACSHPRPIVIALRVPEPCLAGKSDGRVRRVAGSLSPSARYLRDNGCRCSRGAQTLVTSCDNRYGRHCDVHVEPAALAPRRIRSKIGVSRCEQPHVVRQ